MTALFVTSYILSILFLMIGIGWLVACGSRNRVTYSFLTIELLLIIWLVSQLVLVGAVNSLQAYIGYYMCTTVVCVVGSIWLFFAMNFVRIRISKAIYGVIVIVPLIHLVLLYTNNIHSMFYSNMESLNHSRGVFFWTNFAYTYITMAVGLILIWKSCIKNQLYKKSVGVLLTMAVLAPLLLNFVYVFNVVESSMDLTPVAFTLSAMLILIAVRNFGFLNINGMALEKIIKEINQGVIVYNMYGNVSYCNSMGQKYLELLHIKSEAKEEWEITSENSFYNVKKLVNYNYYGKPVAYTLVISDVTRYYELIKKNDELSSAKSSLQAEKERNIIAQQLHDTMGHTLTKINTLARMSSIENTDYTSQIEEIATEGLVQLRETVNVIKENKPMLMTTSLKALVNTKGINIRLTVQGQDDSKYMPLTHVVYDSVREAITNALKYSKAENMEIILRFKESGVEVFIFDDGVGCQEIKTGNGLSGIENRVKAVNGSVSFSSIVNEGFQIIIKLPLEEIKND